MTPSDLISLAGQFGPLGMMIGYLIMRDIRADRLEEKKAEADKQLAASLALLTAAIQGLK